MLGLRVRIRASVEVRDRIRVTVRDCLRLRLVRSGEQPLDSVTHF